jgi:hypothetical protein
VTTRLAAFALLAITACTASNDTPSSGTYTIEFPSTAAAVATDNVQLFVFDPPTLAADRAGYCQSLIQARKLKADQKPIAMNQPVNTCELLGGKKPITIDYGDKAILAVAQRNQMDFMIGCAIQTLGNGDASLPIDLSLVDVSNPVPPTTCMSVTDFCTGKCPAQ